MLSLFVLLNAITLGVNSQEVKWYTIEEAIKLNEKEPRKIVIDVYTNWCSWCKVMDKNTFSNKIIAEYLNEKYYPVKFNAEQTEDVTILGQTFKFVPQGKRGYHELAAALLNGKLGYPSIVFMDENNQIIHLEQRYIEAKLFDMMIKFIGNDHYKTEKWENWTAEYKSPIE